MIPTSQVPQQPAMLTTVDVAKLLRVHPDTVRRWRKLATTLRYVKLNNKTIRYFDSDVADFLTAKSNPTPKEPA